MVNVEIKNVDDVEYTVRGEISFNADGLEVNMNAKDALEIAYALFDWAGMDYTILDEINEKVED